MTLSTFFRFFPPLLQRIFLRGGSRRGPGKTYQGELGEMFLSEDIAVLSIVESTAGDRDSGWPQLGKMEYFFLKKYVNFRQNFGLLYIVSDNIPEGVSPWALLRRTGRRKCPNFSKFSLLFFFGFGLYLVQEKRGKKIFRIGQHFRLSDFPTFRLSDFPTFSQNLWKA